MGSRYAPKWITVLLEGYQRDCEHGHSATAVQRGLSAAAAVMLKGALPVQHSLQEVNIYLAIRHVGLRCAGEHLHGAGAVEQEAL